MTGYDDEEDVLDEIEFSILKVIADADTPLWKKRVRERITEHTDELPLLEDISMNTVSKRIDRLHNEGMLATRIIEPADLNRELIIAYTVTESGKKQLATSRQAYIRDIVRHNIFLDYKNNAPPKGPLMAAIQDEFELSNTATDKLDKRFSAIEIAAILALYLIEIESQELHTEHLRELVRKVARGELTMEDALNELE